MDDNRGGGHLLRAIKETLLAIYYALRYLVLFVIACLRSFFQ